MVAVFSLRGCARDSAAAAEKDAVQTETGLVYKETVGGSGAVPTQLDTVEVHYEGTMKALSRHFMLKMIILPRQARDTHRENSKKRTVFL